MKAPELLPQWQVADTDDGSSLSWHRTRLAATRALGNRGDAMVVGPYWPNWQLRLICRIRGHRVGRSTAVWVRDRDRPPTQFSCRRCYAKLGCSWDTYGNVVRYGSEGVTYDGEWHD